MSVLRGRFISFFTCENGDTHFSLQFMALRLESFRNRALGNGFQKAKSF